MSELKEGNIKNIPATIRILGPLKAPASGPLPEGPPEIEIVKIRDKC
jgi:hypothetical protein